MKETRRVLPSMRHVQHDTANGEGTAATAPPQPPPAVVASPEAQALLSKAYAILGHEKMPVDWVDILEARATGAADGGSATQYLAAAATKRVRRGLDDFFRKFREGKSIGDDQTLHDRGISRYESQTSTYRDGRSDGKGNYAVLWRIAYKQSAKTLVSTMTSHMLVTGQFTGFLRRKLDRWDWGEGPCCLSMSGEVELNTVKRYFAWPPREKAACGRNNAGHGRVRDDGIYFLLLGSAVLAGVEDKLEVEVVGWMRGGQEDELVVHETLAFAAHLRGAFFTPESYNMNGKIGRRFSTQTCSDGDELTARACAA